MKKALTILLAVLLVATMALTLSACNPCKKGLHNWDEDNAVIVPATCEQTGSKTVYCTRCGIEDTVTIPLADHNYGTLHAATETTIAYYQCSVCHKYFNESKQEVTSISKGQGGVDPAPGTSYSLTVNVDSAKGSVVAADGNELAATYEVNTVVNFKVNAKTGYAVSEVKVNGTVVTATDGVYTLTVTENMTIDVTFRTTGGGTDPDPQPPVVDPNPSDTTLTLEIGKIAEANHWANQSVHDELPTDDLNISISGTQGTTPPTYYEANGGTWRIYKANKDSNNAGQLIITAANGAELVSVQIEYRSGGFASKISKSGDTYTVTADEKQEVVFTAGSDTVQITKIVIVYKGGLVPCTHEWQPAENGWTWNTQGEEPTATLKLECSKCDETTTETATVSHQDTYPDCTSNGTRTYTATVEYDDETYTDSSYTTPLDPKGHTEGDLVTDDPAGHYHKCSECGQMVEQAKTPHNFTYEKLNDENHKATCGTCGYTIAQQAHTWSEPEYVDETNHEMTCTAEGCDATKTEEHYFGAAEDEDCECGAEKHVHEWDTSWTTDGEGHWYKCTASETCEAKHEYKKHTSAHKYASDEVCQEYCSVCQRDLKQEQHKFDSAWADNDEGKHARSCANCSHEFTEDHVWGAPAQVAGNAAQHKLTCTKCSAEKLEDHSFGTPENRTNCACGEEWCIQIGTGRSDTIVADVTGKIKDNTKYESNSVTMSNGVTMTWIDFAKNGSMLQTRKSPVSTLQSSAFPGKITKITITMSTTRSGTFYKLSFGNDGSTFGNEEVNVTDANGLTFEYELTGNYTCFQLKHEHTNMLNVTSIVVEYETRTENHKWVRETSLDEEPTCTEAGKVGYKCSRCDATKTEKGADATGHSWTVDTEVGTQGWTWNTEGAEPTATLAFKCTKCPEKHTENATISHADTYTDCTSQGLRTYTAKLTFEKQDYEDSSYTKSLDAKGHVYVESEWQYNDQGHYHWCTQFDEQGHMVEAEPIAHDYDGYGYDDNEDGEYHSSICGVCEYILEEEAHEWIYDDMGAQGHHQVCAKCEAIKDGSEESHEYTEESNTKCGKCGAINGHTEHTGDGNWTGDRSGHWQGCTFEGCNEKVDFTSTHNSKWEKINESTHKEVCSVCGYTMTASAAHQYSATQEGFYTVDETSATHTAKCTVCGETMTHTSLFKPFDDGTEYHIVYCETAGCHVEDFEVFDEHDYDSGTATDTCKCGAIKPEQPAEPKLTATFNMGTNKSSTEAGDTNASNKWTSETNNGRTLTISSSTQLYFGAYSGDEICVRLGTGSATGSFTFTVDSDITKIRVNAARYKTDTGNMTISGANGASSTTYTLTNSFAWFEFDTTTEKTITIASTAKRILINTIEWWGPNGTGGGSTTTPKCGNDDCKCDNCTGEGCTCGESQPVEPSGSSYYQKLTGTTIETGEYLIVYVESGKGYVFDASGAINNKPSAVQVAMANDKIDSAAIINNMRVQITSLGGGSYSVEAKYSSATNKFLGTVSSGTNFAASASSVSLKITMVSDHVEIIVSTSSSTSTRAVLYNTGNGGQYGAYATSNATSTGYGWPTLFKYVEVTAS